MFPYYVFKGRKPLYLILAIILRQYMYGNRKLNSFYRRLIEHRGVKRLQKKLVALGG
jgi:hypothetical protein